MSSSNPSTDLSSESNARRCAACKYLRRRCSVDCVLSPFFPAYLPDRFAYVHKIFGAGNVARMLQSLPVDQRAEAADHISMETYWRMQDPVYGSVAIIEHLQQQINATSQKLAITRAQIAIQSAQQYYNAHPLPAQPPPPPPPPPQPPPNQPPELDYPDFSVLDCGKNDPELSKEMEKQFVDLLTEDLELQKVVAEEHSQHVNTTLVYAKRLASQYQREAEKCNAATEFNLNRRSNVIFMAQ